MTVRRNNLADIFEEMDADFFCLQETKLQEGQIDLEFLGYRSYWNYAEKKGYSGTAIYTKHEPLSVAYGIGIDEHDHEGRVITLEMEDFYLVCVYTPNSQDGLKRLDYRMKWEDDFRAYLTGLAAKTNAKGEKMGVIVCGDLNVSGSASAGKSRDPFHAGMGRYGAGNSGGGTFRPRSAVSHAHPEKHPFHVQ